MELQTQLLVTNASPKPKNNGMKYLEFSHTKIYQMIQEQDIPNQFMEMEQNWLHTVQLVLGIWIFRVMENKF